VRIEAAEDWFCEVLKQAILAGRWREAVRVVPAAADALGRAADRKSAAATALLTEKLMGAPRPYQDTGMRPRVVGLGGLIRDDANGVGAAGPWCSVPTSRPGQRL
jgi:hypothetical protein